MRETGKKRESEELESRRARERGKAQPRTLWAFTISILLNSGAQNTAKRSRMKIVAQSLKIAASISDMVE